MNLQNNSFQYSFLNLNQTSVTAKTEALDTPLTRATNSLSTRSQDSHRTPREILKDLHEELQREVKTFRNSEARLIELLQKLDEMKGYYDLGYGSLYEYCVVGLKLSEGQASAFINVARKAKHIPELTEAIKENRLSVSKIKRMAVVLNPANAADWIEKAEKLSTRDLETEVARLVPPRFTMDYRERISQKIVRVNFALTTETFEKLEAAKDLLEAANYEAVITELLNFYLKRKDPVKKAERVMEKAGSRTENEEHGMEITDHAVEKEECAIEKAGREVEETEREIERPSILHSARNAKRMLVLKVGERESSEPQTVVPVAMVRNVEESAVNRPALTNTASPAAPSSRVALRPTRRALTAKIQHLVNLRDQGRCQHRLPNGRLCASRRYIHLHHIHDVARGGTDHPANLITLCSSHHRLKHRGD